MRSVNPILLLIRSRMMSARPQLAMPIPMAICSRPCALFYCQGTS